MQVLIIGKNSYIGEHIKDHLETAGHAVTEADAITSEWEEMDYSAFDAVVHVAAIVHGDAKTASEALFEKVNTAMPVAAATRAKAAGVKQFVFLSTMAVFGVDKALSAKDCVITADTPCNPVSLYGKSKWAAEQQLAPLADDNFTVSVVRPPNVYGANCKGNYMGLFAKLAKLMVVCPAAFTDVRQSMLYIDNLSEAVRLILEGRESGVFMPQDETIPNTVDLIEGIRRVDGKKTIIVRRPRIPMGSRSSKKGGGGNGGSTSGRMSREAARQTSNSSASMLK